MATASPRASSRPALPRESTATPRRRVRRRLSHGVGACTRASGRRSSSRGSSGARCWPRLAASSRGPRTPRPVSPPSQSWWRPRSRALRRGTRLPARGGAGGATTRRDIGGTRGIASGSLRGRRRGGRPPVTHRKRHDGSLRTRRQRYHGGLVEHHRGCLSYRQAVADRGHERRLDGAPDRPSRSSRRLLSCHRPDRRRREGGGHQVGGWKPDRRRRPVSGAS